MRTCTRECGCPGTRAATIYRREPNGKGDGIFRTNAGDHPTCILVRVRAYGLLKERLVRYFWFYGRGSLPLGTHDKYLSIAFRSTRLYI